MSFFGSIGNAIGSAVHGIGKVAEKGAPLANFIPGIGPAVAAGIGGLGGLAAGDGVMGGLKGALGGYLGGALPGGGGLSGIGGRVAGGMGVMNAAGGGGGGGGSSSDPLNPYGQTDPFDPSSQNAQGGAGAASGGGGMLQGVEQFLQQHGGLGGALGSAAGFLTGNGGKNALGLAQGVNAAMLGKTSTNYAKDALGTQTGLFNAQAPLRAAGEAGMLDPSAGVAAKIAAIPNRNPYSQPQPGLPQQGLPQTPQLAPVGARP